MLVTIRDAEHHDVDILANLNRSVHQAHVAAHPSYFKQPEAAEVAALFRSRLARADTFIWIASVDGVAIGYVVGVLRERAESTLCRARRLLEIEEIGVSEAHRRNGVARALLDRVLAVARSQAISDVELTSWAFNADAHAAFRALGFRPLVVRFQHDGDSKGPS